MNFTMELAVLVITVMIGEPLGCAWLCLVAHGQRRLTLPRSFACYRSQSPPDDVQDSFEHDVLGHFRLTSRAFYEDDRYFTDGQTESLYLIHDLYLEAVPA